MGTRTKGLRGLTRLQVLVELVWLLLILLLPFLLSFLLPFLILLLRL